jgi:hypothetical protein
LDKLASTNSVEQHVYYNHQQAPERIQSYAKKTGNFQAAQERNTELWKVKQIEEGKGVPRQAALQAQIAKSFPNILRTVHLPNEKVGQIRTEIDKLNFTIQEQRQQQELVIHRLREEKGAFEETQREKHLFNNQKLEAITKEIMELEVYNQQLIRDHVDALSFHELEERRQQEELESLRQEN